MLHWLKKLLHVEQTSKKEKAISATFFFAYIFIAGYIGNNMNVEAWAFYNNLTKPNFTPPGPIFGMVWLILFICIALSGYYVWNFYKIKWMRKAYVGLYAINGLLIYLWPYFFFAQQSIDKALYIIVMLIIVVELMMLIAFHNNKRATYLLVPYLAWVFFATYLNTSILMLNS
jgi:translocator protein